MLSAAQRRRFRNGFLKDFPLGRFREGSARFREQGSAMVFLRISLAGKVPQGSAKVPQGSARFREGSAGFRNGFLKDFPCWEGSARFREGSARFREGCGLRVASCEWVPQGSAGFRKVPQWFS